MVRASAVAAALVLLGVERAAVRRSMPSAEGVVRNRAATAALPAGLSARRGHPVPGRQLAPGLSRRAAHCCAASVCLRLRQPAVVDVPAQVRSRFRPFRSFSASRCFSGSGSTGSTCSSAMVALAFWPRSSCAGTRDDVNTHIFNPSSFPLAVVLALCCSTTLSGTTWVFEVATTKFYPPRDVSRDSSLRVAGAASVRRHVDDDVRRGDDVRLQRDVWTPSRPASTSSPDSHAPIAVFLGMHFLAVFTDSATSPRTSRRIIYGTCSTGSTTVLVTYWPSRVKGRPGSTTNCCRCRCSTCPPS